MSSTVLLSERTARERISASPFHCHTPLPVKAVTRFQKWSFVDAIHTSPIFFLFSFFLSLLGSNPWVLCMLGKSSTSGLYLQPHTILFTNKNLVNVNIFRLYSKIRLCSMIGTMFFLFSNLRESLSLDSSDFLHSCVYFWNFSRTCTLSFRQTTLFHPVYTHIWTSGVCTGSFRCMALPTLSTRKVQFTSEHLHEIPTQLGSWQFIPFLVLPLPAD